MKILESTTVYIKIIGNYYIASVKTKRNWLISGHTT